MSEPKKALVEGLKVEEGARELRPLDLGDIALALHQGVPVSEEEKLIHAVVHDVYVEYGAKMYQEGRKELREELTAQHLKREQDGSEAIASKAIDRILRGFNSHEEAVAYLAPLLIAAQPPQELEGLREAVRNVDWMQVLLNLMSGQETGRDGQPCFWIDPEGIEPRFCLRAKFWAGHGDEHGHNFVPLEAALTRQSQPQELVSLREALKALLESCSTRRGGTQRLHVPSWKAVEDAEAALTRGAVGGSE